MNKGQWFVGFNMNISGSAGMGEHFNHDKKMRFPLFADNSEDAEKQGIIFAQQLQRPSREIIKLIIIPYYPSAREEDRFIFSNFSVYFEAKKISLQI